MRRLQSRKDLRILVTQLRPLARQDREIRESVERILSAVKKTGDRAVVRYSKKFDGVDPRPLKVRETEFRQAMKSVHPAVLRSLENAAERIRAFHERQVRKNIEVRTKDSYLAQRIDPIAEVGVYAPGGLAPYASTVLMDVIPAQVAGCPRIVLCSSPKIAHGGTVAPTILAAARILGVSEVVKVGGPQAIAAMAFGTESLSPVSMICGPGNAYVNEAKRQVQGTVKIDSLAGPTEILVIADDSADPRYIAADLIGQIEHGSGASGILVSPSSALADRVEKELAAQAKTHPRNTSLQRDLKKFAFFIKARDLNDAARISDAIAPEHLEVLTENPLEMVDKLHNAGAIFVGPYSPEPVGDYTAGPNHVLPTGGCARFSSPLNVDDFVKKTSIIHLERTALERLAEDTVTLAEAEGFTGHAQAVRIRLEGGK